ncbi:hypothetical protein CERZMDRAFT_90817 [Cercospora zeae-maydis SCOH1-5]|uniref:Uncharacterized protein n=1 Tax=Cercospora zeae-maydis SCOH1-5 TaxID=717836 RepID=A0A6A6FF18_9PEZI|nr:hypothetical protein CERZMDRAFT_90817 [Cercospora zeae-maydis SCOH1-5]
MSNKHHHRLIHANARKSSFPPACNSVRSALLARVLRIKVLSGMPYPSFRDPAFIWGLMGACERELRQMDGLSLDVMRGAYLDLALVFLLLRFRRRTRFFLHFALILAVLL